MSFSSEAFIKKLSGLQDTQESIVSISQWVLFHHRYSKECAKIWSTFVLYSSNSSAKRLNLLYLCNDVVQRARRKRKPEFINEFAEILPSVMKSIYFEIDSSVKPKVDRLVNVWEERAVFDGEVILKLRQAIKESTKKSEDTARPAKSSMTSVPSSSSSPIVPELKHLNDLFMSLNNLTDISQSNLTQFGIQSKTYLPVDPSKSENLPSPKIYISKLNMLEKLSSVSISNIKDIQNIKQQISTQLANLSKTVLEGSKTDDTKISIIENKVKRLLETRKELQEMLEEDKEPTPEEPSPEFDEDDDDDEVPTYEDVDSDNGSESEASKSDGKSEASSKSEDSSKSEVSANSELSSKSESSFKSESSDTTNYNPKKRSSRSPSGTPKRVAFSEDIEVKEFDREEETGMNIEPSDEYNVEDVEDNVSMSLDFTMHHKDDLELKHEHDHPVGSDDEDGYDPAAGLEEIQATSDYSDTPSDSPAIDVMSLLSKLS